MKPLLELTVADIMHPNVITIPTGASAVEAIRMMGTQKISALIVEPEHAHDAHGIITRKDLVIEAMENLETLTHLKVGDIATKPVISIPPHLGIKHAVRLMRLVGVRRLAVFDGPKLVGLISNSDVFREVLKLGH
ncbi:MAG: CBS domain-containing protein [Deltaproteobacteria bacterium]|nr:CBS domain-containing protein [Deltaproteobacteria bacterium]